MATRRAMSDDVTQRIADRLKELREQHKLSIRALARASGLSPELLSRSERGVTTATVASISKVCEALGIDLPTFFEFDRGVKTAPVDPLLDEVAILLAKLPRPAQRQAVRGLRSLLEAGAEKGSQQSVGRAPAKR
jgi:transcriptional regulator with XRE-family HTH domain